jgi:AcrR family transcriptional regulator
MLLRTSRTRPARSARARSTRRDDQARETRARLVSAAVELVAEVGWRRTTVELIVERAGVAKGTFFVHFKTKDALVTSLVELQVAAAREAREAVTARGGTAVERLAAATLSLGHHATENVELTRAVLIASLESREVEARADALLGQVRQRMVEDARDAIAAGLLEGPDAETIAGLLLASYLGATLRCGSAPVAIPAGEILEPLVAATLRALAPRGKPAEAPPRARRRALRSP